MYPLLIVRVEIVCLILLIFLGINARYYKMGKDNGSFKRMLFFAIGHVVFDIITVLTVNNLDQVPIWVNYIAHVVFYLFAILFAHEFFCYVIALSYREKRIQKMVRILGLSLVGLYLLLLPVLPIEYLHGNGTNYSLGPAAIVGYGLGMIFLAGSAVILTVNFKKLAPHVRMALIPMLTVMVAAECIQIVVPELLITGGAATVVTVAFFFSLENPADVFRQKLLIDALTGVKSRNSYELEIQQMEKEFVQNRDIRFGMVFCDINDLKEVNDKFGHLKGDDYIGDIAQILMRDLQGAESIYRMGGDEFLAIYRNTDKAKIQQEIDSVNADCKAMSEKVPYQMSVAIAYAVSGEEYASLRNVLQTADYLMYQNKTNMRREKSRLSQDGQQMNVAGLTDRIFDAFAATGGRNYLFMANLATNVSRWSQAAVDYFGLPGEFIYDNATVWMKYIHPDDRADYRADIGAVFSGKKKEHNIEYRVRNKRGEYVVCTCRGRILKGKNGEPDLFVATLVNHGIGETIDPITGLHNERILVPYMEKLLQEKTRASFLTVKICSFSRINLLYGHATGDQILGQFSVILRRIIGQKGRVFRIGETRFTLCLPGMDAEDVSRLYSNLTNAARFEITMDSITIPLRLAGGAFTVDEEYTGSVATVRNNLTSVLERSEQEDHGRLAFYSDPTRGESQVDFKLLTAIYQDAVTERKGFRLEYQPVHQMDTGEVIGAEALLRWRSEEFGKVPPGQFVPWLENDPCFFQVGWWILRKALTDAREMLPVVPEFVIKVNITVLQLEDERFNTMVLEVLRETGFPPQQLCLELTERCRELDEEYLKSQIEFFHKFGIQISLDDVGTGFSSLGVLLNLPIDEIKLDKTFITDIRSREANQAYVGAIVDATRRLGLHSCLEGIEDRKTYEYLRSFGATCCQGYYFSKSLPARDFKAYLLAEKRGGNRFKETLEKSFS
ncbi:EAL domain-containing protein [Adlercreutzia sp. ZJ138]|uniref:EAL domain-containing protein n=1 Tax=Adlercreutzia sp. ZJ138 TaxID=2709405 RepID=UPI0013ED61E7|nr:EAL domain-containing protein [Adlercreutzia sp. ZJ138]